MSVRATCPVTGANWGTRFPLLMPKKLKLGELKWGDAAAVEELSVFFFFTKRLNSVLRKW